MRSIFWTTSNKQLIYQQTVFIGNTYSNTRDLNKKEYNIHYTHNLNHELEDHIYKYGGMYSIFIDSLQSIFQHFHNLSIFKD